MSVIMHYVSLRLAGDDIDIDLPEGINVEEARMLEAAMLGIPYAGRMPGFGPRGPTMPPDPAAVAQRVLRQEQDDAFEESLAADRWGAGAWGVCAWGGGGLPTTHSPQPNRRHYPHPSTPPLLPTPSGPTTTPPPNHHH